MVREGSITGISTSLEITKSSDENLEVVIYKNGKQVGFGNIVAGSEGMKKDHDVQSRDIVSFNAGDVISVYVQSNGIIFKDAITSVEISTKASD